MKRPTAELLAPAGTLDALKAAFCAGADAVYLGGASFGARADVGFDKSALTEAVHTAHLFGRRVYVTVNTLIKERELPQVEDALRFLETLHVDAVLVQDPGVVSLCLEKFPGLPMHASTQMALSGEIGAEFARSLGMSRVVLARECRLSEIKRAADTGIEIEVFAHGALCVCASGLCLFSSMIGGRSGNRGRCAQPCRMPYTYRGQTKAWLSPADLCARDQLPALLSAGAKSLKLEGRLKRPEYVYVVTKAYRAALDAAAKGALKPMNDSERDALTQIFSRGAFTKGYAGGAEDAGVIYPDRVKPVGLSIGEIESVDARRGTYLARCRLKRPLNDGDGLEIDSQRLIYSGPNAAAGQTAVLRLREPASRGALVRRTEDETQLSGARREYEGGALLNVMPIHFDAELSAPVGARARLTVEASGARVTVSGDAVLPADARPLSAPLVRRAMEKTGGTPFLLDGCAFSGDNAYLPAASLNALRRDALSALTDELIARFEKGIPARAPRVFAPEPSLTEIKHRVFVRSDDLALLNALLAGGADYALFGPTDYRENALKDALMDFPKNAALCLPPVMSDETLRMVHALCEEARVPVMLGSIGQLGLKWKVPVLSDYGVPVMNSRAEGLLAAQNVSGVTLSPEMSAEDILSLPQARMERILPVYGRVRLMTLAHCPERTSRGFLKGHSKCDLCARGQGAGGRSLTDRLRCDYPLRPVRLPEGCRVDVLSDKPLNLLPRGDLLRKIEASYLLSFTTEDKDAAGRVLNAYRAFMDGGAPSLPGGTVGRFVSGVL